MLNTNLGYRHYADKLEEFTFEKMTDNSDIPDVINNKEKNND